MVDTSPRQVTVASYLATRLRQCGVDHLFGVPGDFNLALLDGLLDGGLAWVGTANELNAAYAADGYARTRGCGAVVTTLGVGELSAMNGVAGAFAESVPLVQISGLDSTTAARQGAFDHHTFADGDFDRFVRAYREVTLCTEVLAPDTAAEQIDRALTACVDELRPVYLGVPVDVVGLPVDGGRLERPLPRRSSAPGALAEVSARLRARLDDGAAGVGGRPPVTLLVGHLARRRALAGVLTRLAGTGSVRVATQLGAKGLLDESDPAAVGCYVGALSDPTARRAVEQAELLVTVGTVYSDMVTGMYTHRVAPAVEIELHRTRIGDVTVDDVELGDVLGVLADALGKALGTTDRAPARTAAASPPPDPEAGDHELVTHDALWATVERWLPAATTLIADAGTAYYGAAGLRLPADSQLVGQPIWSSIGYTLPATLGVALAATHRRPVLVIGDGAAQMTVQELATIVHRGLDPIVILLNNGGYTIERAIRSPSAPYQDVTVWDWPALAAALSPREAPVLARRIGTAAELRAALRAAAEHPSAVFLEVVLAPHDAPTLVRRLAESLGAAAPV